MDFIGSFCFAFLVSDWVLNVIFFSSSGDELTGTLYYSLFDNGAADGKIMGEFCFDVFVLGNHEFDDGDSSLARFLDIMKEGGGGGEEEGLCNTDVLGANVSPSTASALVLSDLHAYSIVEVGGVSYAVIGLDVAQKTMSSSAPDPGTFLFHEAATAQAYINILEGQGYDKIILLTHIGYSQDMELARMLRGVDVIVGGDSHTLLGNDQLGELLASTPVGPYPTQEKDKDENTGTHQTHTVFVFPRPLTLTP